jgi:hypothetical protein
MGAIREYRKRPNVVPSYVCMTHRFRAAAGQRDSVDFGKTRTTNLRVGGSILPLLILKTAHVNMAP